MHFEIKDCAMMPRTVRVLGHREAPGDACGEIHARGRVGRHRGFEVIAMQMQHDAPVAPPAQLDPVALRDAQRGPLGGELAPDQLQVEGALGRERQSGRRECCGGGERPAQRWRTSMLPLPSVPFAL
jgi:hypothetical protein